MPVVLNKRTNKIPAGAVYVGRPSKWGNPMSVREILELFPTYSKQEAQQAAVDWYKRYIQLKPDLLASLPELRGKNLVCWCSPLPCHADVLLELANRNNRKEV